MIDQTTEGGKALQAVVKTELKKYLGQDYSDDVLPLYIVVMLAHGNQQPLVKDNLEAFLGSEKAGLFSTWLFQHLKENLEKYDPPPAEVAEEPQAKSVPREEDDLDAAEPDSGQKRSREKREKIEWKAEKHGSDRMQSTDTDHHNEKRRRSAGREERSMRGDHDFPRRESGDRDRHRDRTRDRDSAQDRARPKGRDYDEREAYRRHHDSSDYRDTDGHGRQNGRHTRHSAREDDRLFSSRRRNDRDDRFDGHNGRTEDQRSERRDRRDRQQPNVRDERVPVPSRLASRLGRTETSPVRDSRSMSPTPPASPRSAGKPSVFERLKKVDTENPKSPRSRQDKRPNGLDSAIKTRMRMDHLASSKTARPAPDIPGDESEPEQSTPKSPSAHALVASTSIEAGQETVAAELRQIREQLAKMNAERAEKKNLELATQIARKAVVQNVHFNATPEILKAHFSGCGTLLSAVIEKEATGRPRGVAVLEFETEEARRVALTLSGSLLLGRPVTVLPKEPAKSRPAPNFHHMEGAPQFRPRAPMFQRGRGRGAFPGRHTLKNNKYVRPTTEIANGATPSATA